MDAKLSHALAHSRVKKPFGIKLASRNTKNRGFKVVIENAGKTVVATKNNGGAWNVLEVFPGADVPGYIAAVAGVLAEQHIGVEAWTTFGKDYFVVKAADGGKAFKILREYFGRGLE